MTGTCENTRRAIGRRELFKESALGLAGLGLLAGRVPADLAPETRPARRGFTIDRIERTTVRVPFRPIPERAMDRELPHWRYSEVVEVHLHDGTVGFGETLLYYTWGATGDGDVKRAAGANALELLWDDSLGAGLQMALFDAVGRALGVPIHVLLGRQVHQRTPLSWWNIDMPPEDMAAECRLARQQGYLSYKTKGRPWFDVWEQVAASARVVPAEFKIDMDFNATLLDAERAIPILKDLEKYPQVDIYESPIPQSDVAGNKAIHEATRVKIALHYGSPPPLVTLSEDICDGFVVGGGASRLLHQAAVCAMADKPFWLQLVGTGITAAYSLHFGAVLSHATWPAVNCHQLYTHTLLAEPIRVEQGTAAIPQRPGLGYELDRDAVQRFRVEKPKTRPEPERLIETRWPDGRVMYTANTGHVNFMLNAAVKGDMPFFERGVQTKLVPNDGSARWRELYQKARRGPLLIRP